MEGKFDREIQMKIKMAKLALIRSNLLNLLICLQCNYVRSRPVISDVYELAIFDIPHLQPCILSNC